MAKIVYTAVFLFTLCFVQVLSHTDYHHSPHNATKNADIHYPKLNSDTQPLTSIDRQTRQNDNQNPSEDGATHSPSGSDQSNHAIQLEIGSSQNNESTNETSWHAHKHLDEIFNTTAKVDAVAMGESEYFIEKIFRKYSERNVLLLAGLQHLMENIGLGEHNEEKGSMVGETGQKVHEEKTGRLNLKRRSTSAVTHVHSDHSECYNVRELLSDFHFDRLNGLDLDHFLLLCPAIIDQLDNSGCHHHQGNQGHGRLSPGDGNNKDHAHAHEDESSDHHKHTHADTDDVLVSEAATNKVVDSGDIPPLVWVYSSVAVLVISLVGLLGVAVIPVMRRLFYKNLLQFLVALAVGALCGDALLHLLPHALSSGHGKHEKPASRRDHATSYDHDDHKTISDSDHDHGTAEEEGGHDDTSVWKGLVALLGLLFFFLAERVLIIVTSWRAEKKLQRKAQLKAADLVGAKRIPEARGLFLMVPATQNTDPSYDALIRETAIIDDDDDDNKNSSDIFLSSNYNHHVISSSSQSLHEDQGHSEEDQGHDEGHGHGHSHHQGDVPGSVSAVAWMVILGDGIHNLSDGLAIGAAFASSVTGGFSTSVAVFCHELPHEIGDFAMLLKAGMPAKQALMYNVLSSVLCFIGMVIGVLLGQLENASSWIFCTVAGMFLYISLADMLPQLTVTKRKGGPSPGSQLLLQCVGVGVGAGIMLIIAVFEHDLKTLID
ncbi:hypothetical protein V1264_008236 [Littorina saxatilis]